MYAKVRCLIAIKSLIRFATCHKPAVSNINCSFIFSIMSNSYFPEKTSPATRSPMGQYTIGQMFDKTVDNLILMMMMMMLMMDDDDNDDDNDDDSDDDDAGGQADERPWAEAERGAGREDV